MRMGGWQGAGDTRGTAVLRSCDDCGHHGDVGRLTFCGKSFQASQAPGVWGCGHWHLIIALTATLTPKCGKISLHLVVSVTRGVSHPVCHLLLSSLLRFSSPSPTALQIQLSVLYRDRQQQQSRQQSRPQSCL